MREVSPGRKITSTLGGAVPPTPPASCEPHTRPEQVRGVWAPWQDAHSITWPHCVAYSEFTTFQTYWLQILDWQVSRLPISMVCKGSWLLHTLGRLGGTDSLKSKPLRLVGSLV